MKWSTRLRSTLRLKSILLLSSLLCSPATGNHNDENAFSNLSIFSDLNDILLYEQSPTKIPLKVTPLASYKQHKKSWTFIVYIAADNDLRGFAPRNIKQMAAIGSNDYINIIVHLDIRLSGNNKITRRYYIKKNELIHVNVNDPLSQKMDSGSPQTLISCGAWAVENFPAEHYALILWNHGTGIIDPGRGKIFNVSELFILNPLTNKLELDRSIGYLDLIDTINTSHRGVCWDDSTGHFLTNQDLEVALETIYSKILNGKKFSIIGFDACLMGMVEVANIIKEYADIMIASPEVIYGTGFNYTKVLSPFTKTTLDPHTFAKHIVRVYEQTYGKITDDFTLSALNLNAISALEENINTVATLLISSLEKQDGDSIRQALRASKSKLLCTHFDEPSYLDLHHLYSNLEANLPQFKYKDPTRGKVIKEALAKALAQGRALIKTIAFANTAGATLSNSTGISIYFPERKVHNSYYKTNFAQSNQWIKLIAQYHKA
jgi:hypothetical protein